MRIAPPRVLAGALAFLLAAAAPAGAQLTLDLKGGILNENWEFTVTGTPPGEYWVVAFADTTGPLPIAIVDPFDPRSWDLDVSMFSYGGGWGLEPAPVPALTIPNAYPQFVGTGAHLYGQAFTLPGPATLVDLLSNNIVIVVAGPHGTSTDTLGVPIQTRGFATGQRLSNGDHMIFGGNDGALQGGTYLKSVERWNYRMQSVTSGPDLGIERSFAASMTLDDGRVLVCGGNDDLNNVLTSAEVYDPATNTITPTGSMAQGRYFHSLVKLLDGRVMAFGGSTTVDNSSSVAAALALVNSATDKAEIWNPATGLWTSAANMPWKRTGVSAALLPGGRVLVAGGAGPGFLSIPSFFATASRYDAGTNSWVATPSFPGNTRALATTTTLADGRVMLSGGAKGDVLALTLNALADVSVYDGALNQWVAGVPPLPIARTGHSATLMPDGTIVVCGGAFGDVLSPGVTNQVERFTGAGWTTIGQLNHERAFHHAALTHDAQRIFLYGGIESGGIAAIQPSTEMFAP